MEKEIHEQFATDLAEAGIHEGQRMLAGVALLSTNKSKNGRLYLPKALDDITEQASGGKAFLNHPGKAEIKDTGGTRDIRDLLGVFHRAKRHGNKITADLECLEQHWSLVRDIARLNPRCGFSLNARATVSTDDKGGEVVEGIELLRSVDLVSSPAMNTTVWEHFKKRETKDALESLLNSNEKIDVKAVLAELRGDPSDEEVKEFLRKCRGEPEPLEDNEFVSKVRGVL